MPPQTRQVTLPAQPELIPLRERESTTFGSLATEIVVAFLLSHGIMVKGRPDVAADGSVTADVIGDAEAAWAWFSLDQRQRR